MSKKGISFHEVYDLIGVRIILSDENEKLNCWRAYAIITSLHRFNKTRTKDWITTPKKRGYESLHLTMMDKMGKWVEVQIRTERMHKIASDGNASHWKYKEKELTGILDNHHKWAQVALDKAIKKYNTLRKSNYAKE